MTVWIVIIGVLVLAFVAKAIVKLYRRKSNAGYHPDISTRKRLGIGTGSYCLVAGLRSTQYSK